MPNAIYDWIKIKQEYFESEILEANTFIKQKLGDSKAKAGGITRRIKGWTEDKKVWQQHRIDEAQKIADKELARKMKITLEDLLVSKKMLFQLDSVFLELYARKISKDKSAIPLTLEELDFVRNYPARPLDVYARIQNELGLPSNREALETIEKPDNWDEIYEEEFKEWLKERK